MIISVFNSVIETDHLSWVADEDRIDVKWEFINHQKQSDFIIEGTIYFGVIWNFQANCVKGRFVRGHQSKEQFESECREKMKQARQFIIDHWTKGKNIPVFE